MICVNMTLYAIFFATKWCTLVNMTFSCVQKICLRVFKQTQKRNFKIGQNEAEI